MPPFPEYLSSLARILCLVLLLGGADCASAQPPLRSAVPSFGDSGDPEAMAISIAGDMGDEELVGQILMMTWPGAVPPPELLDWIRQRHLGGIKIFGWNGADTVKLAGAIASMQKLALGSGRGIPLLVATDQEGGMVRHIKGSTSQTPGNMAIGATGREDDARLSGFYIGRELAAMGVNMDFAPVVDLATRPDGFVIGPRAFSDEPGKVAILGSAFARGLADAGIIATAKHFPGHGDTLTDSHGRLPVILADARLLRTRELVPFSALIRDGVPAVMAGHLSFPAIDPGGGPASLSSRFMTGILRSELGFKGLAITDDLYMQGAGGGSEAARARQALEAGNDMIMVSRLVGWGDSLWSKLVAACGSDPSFKERMVVAVSRILAVKLRYLKDPRAMPLVPDSHAVPALVPDREGASFFRDLALRAATLISGGEALPVKPGAGIVIASPFPEFLGAALDYYPGATVFRFSYRPLDAAKPEELSAFRATIAGARVVIICVANRAGADFAREASKSDAKLAVLSVDSPVWASGIPATAAVIAVYSDTRPSLIAGLEVISGRAVARGRLPIFSGTLPAVFPPAGTGSSK